MTSSPIRSRPIGSRPVMVLCLALALTGALVALSNTEARAWTSERTIMQGSPTAMGQTNGPVWAVEIAGGKIFVGGGFTSTRPAGAARGSQETGQAYLAAFDAATGKPIASFAPVLRNTYNSSPPIVRAMELSPDGATLYVGGDFNQIDGKTTEHVAAFDTATGDFLGVVGWNGTDGYVAALAVSHDGETLYAGGAFTRANWSHRANTAAFDLTDGSLHDWSPQVSLPVSNESLRVVALAVSADDSQVFVAGPFRRVNGSTAQGFMATSATSGANVSKYKSAYLYSPNSWGTGLAVHGDTVYLTGRDDQTSTLSRTEGVFAINTNTGAQRWYADCYGDSFDVLPVGDDVYVASHAHDCSRNGGMPEKSPRTYLAIHALDVDTGKERPYFVETGGTNADHDTLLMSRALATDGNQLVIGGGFNTVNGVAQANVARFLVGSAAPDRAAWPAAASCRNCAYVDLTVLEGADRDDNSLTYEIYRDWSTTNPIYTTTRATYPYELETFTYRDRGVSVGQHVYYRVLARDAAGNEVWSVRTATISVGDRSLAGGGAAKAAASAQKQGAGWVLAAEPFREEPKLTAAQRAAAEAAAEAGLFVDGSRGPGRKVRRPAPVLDDASVPTELPAATD